MNAKFSTLIAFLLNFSFAILEFIFGFSFNSSAVLADAVHDSGDAIAIGISALLERFSNKEADSKFSLGYKRFSLLGAMITAGILIFGSAFVIIENLPKLFNPEPVNYQGMLILGIIAIAINLLASLVVSKGQTKNESILSLHFLEDILGWLAVILVAIVLNFTDWYFLDPLLSLVISLFILSKALPRFWSNLKIFLAAVPDDMDLAALENDLLKLEEIASINQFNLWSMDGLTHNATLHVCLAKADCQEDCKEKIRQVLKNHQIENLTIEIDSSKDSHQVHHQHNQASSGHNH
ncbi:cation diffusion facilitator family transporter [Streptococcus loxodontisalivarius]|uniref:Cobalt-zinc-cadmium efflux system protein n=1 Tax=Streptococcus loxodontisalivarius TaxID=1349415 RepID=A0ABS2PTL3_9STRE|nr:cation diffusion facilitator family transporter [Streptococcus loxodontisalivarius]MBM7643393.1 cobalt-zinc-cadmium efflux system protein [Streptococcus loxodontisalivarius]